MGEETYLRFGGLRYYAEGIQKFQRQLRLPVSAFSDILKGDARNDIGDQTTKQKADSGTAKNEL
jgi:hypothetical protein